MPKTRHLDLKVGLASSLTLVCALRASPTFAQPVPVEAQVPAAPERATPAATAPPAGASEPRTPDASAAKPAGDEPDAKMAAMQAEMAAMKQALEQVQAQQAAAAAATAPPSGDDGSSGEALKIYGFMDMGIQHIWVRRRAPLAHIFQVNNTSFVVGNLNLYFDAQPIKHFRGLAEVRFTNAPLGDIINYGGLAGTFERKDTFSYDAAGTAINAPMWTASVVLERAWLEWNQHQALKLRVGNYFTPFGIWNEDHGSPTLISLALPQFIIQRWMPIRQTGLMAYGSAFMGDWELGYVGTLSNGRQEISNYNFDNSFGVGGRVYARSETGRFNKTFGLAYFTGKTGDEVVNVVPSSTAPNGIGFENQTTTVFNEHVAGADVSLDIDATRIRAEAVVRRLVYEPGHRPPGNPLYSPGSFAPDAWQTSAYLLFAHQLPWLGIEPYVWGEVMNEPTIVGDLFLIGSAGVNVHFNPSIQLKTQVTRVAISNWLYHSPHEPSLNNTTSIYSRFVMAF
jgi:hypothetical protein